MWVPILRASPAWPVKWKAVSWEGWPWQLLCSFFFFQVNQTAAPWISQPVYNYRLAENAVFVPPSVNLLPWFCPPSLAIWPLNLGNVLFVSPWRAVPVAAKPQETDTEWALEDADTVSITALHLGQQGHQLLYPQPLLAPTQPPLPPSQHTAPHIPTLWPPKVMNLRQKLSYKKERRNF